MGPREIVKYLCIFQRLGQASFTSRILLNFFFAFYLFVQISIPWLLFHLLLNLLGELHAFCFFHLFFARSKISFTSFPLIFGNSKQRKIVPISSDFILIFILEGEVRIRGVNGYDTYRLSGSIFSYPYLIE